MTMVCAATRIALVNNAGIMLDHDDPPAEADVSAVCEILDTNCIATLAVTWGMFSLLKRSCQLDHQRL
ncbi:hypothetical protein [Xylella taiwanensis]|uniref:hypothetical protein n=1 Tax=Xylella taiwanensis TaxID=1444770 RepID=UPI0004BC0A33|nr:hypothetical protein [Xylella taiwanensis]MCD8470485.1 hypothetical protein [Xylella taiwanensis]QKD98138.1 hypothetical protein PLS229_04035 [Xylella taiwanensis]UFN26850.1 hypothetical protein LPH51_09805 [Xylella taiwanensis]